MDELLTRVGVPLDGTMYIGKLMSEPYLSRGFHKIIGPIYSLHVRPLLRGALVWQGEGEVVLTSGERVSVQIMGTERIIPSAQAVQTNFWQPDDAYFSIRASDLTPTQAKEACYFIQPCSPRIETPLRPEEELEIRTADSHPKEPEER